MEDKLIEKEDYLREIGNIDPKVIIKCLNLFFPKWGKMMTRTDEIYYYTGLDTLINGIFKTSEEICLWASRWDFMNDPEEFRVGMKEFRFLEEEGTVWVKDAILRRLKQSHLISFSEYKDFLPMWKMYGDGGRGVMLIFDFKELFKKWGGHLHPCMYKGTKVYNQSVDAIYHFTKNSDYSFLSDSQKIYILIAMLTLFVSISKNLDYVYEREVRITDMENETDGKKYEQKYRVANGVIIPYVEAFMPKESLKGVCLGPLVKSEVNQNTLKEFLCNKGYENVEVSGSNINYR